MARDVNVPVDLVLARALAAQPSKRRRVLVAAGEFFTQTVRLPVFQTSGLSVAELKTALHFEVEPFSNLSATASEIAFCELPADNGESVWQVLQLAHSEMASIQAAARAGGVRLAGFAPLGEALLELDDDNAAPALAQWCAMVVQKPAVYPVLRTYKAASRRATPEFWAVTVSVVLALACVAHYAQARGRRDKLRLTVRHQERLAQEVQQARRINASLQHTLDAHTQKQQEAESLQQTIARYRGAWQVLLAALLEACEPAIVIREIKGTGFFEAQIRGLSADEKSPGVFIARVANLVQQGGWEVHSVYQHNVLHSGSGTSVEYGFQATLELPEGVRLKAEPLADEILW